MSEIHCVIRATARATCVPDASEIIVEDEDLKRSMMMPICYFPDLDAKFRVPRRFLYNSGHSAILLRIVCRLREISGEVYQY